VARSALILARERLLERAGRIDDLAVRKGFLVGVPEHTRTLQLAKELHDDE
jgi:hypothetical protein